MKWVDNKNGCSHLVTHVCTHAVDDFTNEIIMEGSWEWCAKYPSKVIGLRVRISTKCTLYLETCPPANMATEREFDTVPSLLYFLEGSCGAYRPRYVFFNSFVSEGIDCLFDPLFKHTDIVRITLCATSSNTDKLDVILGGSLKTYASKITTMTFKEFVFNQAVMSKLIHYQQLGIISVSLFDDDTFHVPVTDRLGQDTLIRHLPLFPALHSFGYANPILGDANKLLHEIIPRCPRLGLVWSTCYHVNEQLKRTKRLAVWCQSQPVKATITLLVRCHRKDQGFLTADMVRMLFPFLLDVSPV